MPRAAKDPMISEIIGHSVWVLRRERGLHQGELGLRVGVSATAISRIEAGHRGCSIPLLVRLADALEVPPGVLLQGAGRFD